MESWSGYFCIITLGIFLAFLTRRPDALSFTTGDKKQPAEITLESRVELLERGRDAFMSNILEKMQKTKDKDEDKGKNKAKDKDKNEDKDSQYDDHEKETAKKATEDATSKKIV